MKNYIQPGNVLTFSSPFGITSGQGVLLNKFFGVANYDCPIPGNPIEVSVVGVYSLPKAATVVFAVAIMSIGMTPTIMSRQPHRAPS